MPSEFDRLARALALSSGPTLLFARHLADETPGWACDKLGRLGAPGRLLPAGTDPIGALEEAARRAEPGVVLHLTGLDEALAADRERVLARLNTGRERLGQLEHPVVVWTPPAAYMAIGSDAPDLFDWRSGTYRVSAPAGLSPPRRGGRRPAATGQVLPATLLRAYRRHLQQRLRYLDLRGIYDAAEPLRPRLEEMFVPLRVLLWRPSPLLLPLESVLPWQPDRIGLVEAWRQERRLFLVGEAGSGKSAGLRHLAWTLVREARTPLVPVVLRLEEVGTCIAQGWSSGRPFLPAHLLDWLGERLAAGGAPLPATALTTAAKSGQLVLLADGLDEVADPELRIAVADLLGRLDRQYPLAGLITSSRPLAPGGAGLEPPGWRARLVPFDAEQKDDFLRRWARHAYERRWREEAKALGAALEAVEESGPLADRPLLLWAITLVYHNRRELPAERAELFRVLVEALLRRRDRRDLPAEDKRHLLQELAWSLHEAGGTHDTRARVVESLRTLLGPEPRALAAFRGPEHVLELLELQSGLLARTGSKGIRFSHLCYQEYLTARRLLDHEAEPASALCELVRGAWWQGPATLAVEHLASTARVQAARLLRRVSELTSAGKADPVCLFAVARAALNLGARGPRDPMEEGRAGVIEALLRLLHDGMDQAPWVRLEAGALLGWLGDPRVAELDWAPVPGHQVAIARFPITNSQYAGFVHSDGYAVRELWTREGWKWRRKRDRRTPEQWQRPGFDLPNAPAAGVSRHEAEAFLAWLAREQGTSGARLPTEAEWNAAAGAADRRYPWGEGFDPRRCNTAEAGVGHPTPVGALAGPTPTAPSVEDLFGNVREWTSSFRGERHQVLKGFSYGDRGGDHGSADAFTLYQGRRWYHRLGFRPVRRLDG